MLLRIHVPFYVFLGESFRSVVAQHWVNIFDVELGFNVELGFKLSLVLTLSLGLTLSLEALFRMPGEVEPSTPHPGGTPVRHG